MNRTPVNTLAALRTEELRLSLNRLKVQLKAQGIKITSYSYADLTAEAKARQRWFAHDAFRNVLQMQLCHLLRRANIKSAAQKSKAAKSMGSAVQMSSPELEAQS
jgi:hypothetical protein